MALGFTFSEYDEWRMLINKDRAKKFMKNFGKAREVKINHFAKVSNMVAPPVLTRTEEDNPKIKWLTIKGIKGYKFAIEGDNIRCVNTKLNIELYGTAHKRSVSFKFSKQDLGTRSNAIYASPLRLAFCIKYDINIRNQKLAGKRIAGTLAEPYIKDDNKGELLWDILHNQE